MDRNRSPVRFRPGRSDDSRDMEFEAGILDRLAEIDLEAVPIFEAATRDFDAMNFEAARAGFLQVLTLAPDFPDALRRLASAEVELEMLPVALYHAEQAYQLDPSGPNAGVLADVLLQTDTASSGERELALAQQAYEEFPDEPYYNYVLMRAAVQAEDLEQARLAAENLTTILPDVPIGFVLLGLLEADAGNWRTAESNLLKARELGFPADEIETLLDETGISSHVRTTEAGFLALYTALGWLIGMGVLFLVGEVLSRLTLAAVDPERPDVQMDPGPREKTIRSVYRSVIALTSLYFYISIPFLIVIVLGLTGGIFYLFFVVGRIPVRLALTLGLAALYTLYAIVRSVFILNRESEPGRALERSEAPGLWALTDSVAEKMNTRPIEEIYITPGTDIAVTELGGLLKKMRGRGRRAFILGLGVLPGLERGPFQAILAHEYGHFRGKDTAGGKLAWQVQTSLRAMATELAARGQARWHNPAWLFINGFYRVFLRISHGASRLQEILADRYAALIYGAGNMVAGLQHVIHSSLLFNYKVNAEVALSLQQNRRLANVYALPEPVEQESLEKLDEQFRKIMMQETSAYDTHPAPADRIRRIELLSGSAGPSPDDSYPVLDLLPQIDRLEAEMTAKVQGNVDKRVEMVRRAKQAARASKK